jgi:hypothetical protein
MNRSEEHFDLVEASVFRVEGNMQGVIWKLQHRMPDDKEMT